MSEPPSEELQRLRRAAFGRDATEADLQAWAEVSAVPPMRSEEAPEPETPAEPNPVANEREDEQPPYAAPETTSRRSRQVVTIAVAVVIASGIGYAIGWAVSDRYASSLRVFDVPATPDDEGSIVFDSINAQDQPGNVPVQILGEQRLVYEDSEFKVWASLGGENFGASDDLGWTSTVCVAVEFSDGSATGRCSSLEEFNLSGVIVPSPLDGDDRVFTWGPTGPLAITHVAG